MSAESLYVGRRAALSTPCLCTIVPRYQTQHQAHLQISACSLHTDTCSHLTKLKELRLNHNKLTSFPADLSALASLRTLEAGSNPIASLDALQPLAGLPALRQLSLKGCPVAALENYRSHVQGLLPRLQVLQRILWSH